MSNIALRPTDGVLDARTARITLGMKVVPNDAPDLREPIPVAV